MHVSSVISQAKHSLKQSSEVSLEVAEDSSFCMEGGGGRAYAVPLSSEHLQLVGPALPHQSVHQPGGVGKEDVLIVQPVQHQQPAWPVCRGGRVRVCEGVPAYSRACDRLYINIILTGNKYSVSCCYHKP